MASNERFSRGGHKGQRTSLRAAGLAAMEQRALPEMVVAVSEQIDVKLHADHEF
jgi:hypothetical protein